MIFNVINNTKVITANLRSSEISIFNRAHTRFHTSGHRFRNVGVYL